MFKSQPDKVSSSRMLDFPHAPLALCRARQLFTSFINYYMQLPCNQMSKSGLQLYA
jgi:hypothetical protein